GRQRRAGGTAGRRDRAIPPAVPQGPPVRRPQTSDNPGVGGAMRLTPEQTEFAAAVREFAETEIRPVIGDYYERGVFPADLVRELGKLGVFGVTLRSEEHTSELQSRENLVCRLLLEKKKKMNTTNVNQ